MMTETRCAVEQARETIRALERARETRRDREQARLFALRGLCLCASRAIDAKLDGLREQACDTRALRALTHAMRYLRLYEPEVANWEKGR